MNHDINKGILGVATTIGSLRVSFAQVETWLRIISLLIGIAVGCITFISIFRSMRRKDNAYRMKTPAQSSSSSSFIMGFMLLFIFVISGCSALVPSEQQKSQSVKATEALATQQSMTIRRALDSGPAIAMTHQQIPTAPRNTSGYSRSVSPGLPLPPDAEVTSTPIHERLEIVTETTTAAGTKSAADGSSISSIPMGVKIGLVGVGIIALIIGLKFGWSAIKTTAFGQGLSAGDAALAEMIRAHRSKASITTDPTELAKTNSMIADLEATRGRLTAKVK
jgi:uncharacterized membrane protein YuzA (DUF378 family)